MVSLGFTSGRALKKPFQRRSVQCGIHKHTLCLKSRFPGSCPQPVLVCGDVPAQVEQLAFPFTELHEGCVGLDLPPAEAA